MTEEDRKALTPMLGKLFITANSSPEKLSTINELVIEAIDSKVAGEAASRAALNKLHLALTKALQEAGIGRAVDVDVEEAVEPEATHEDDNQEISKLAEAVEATSIIDEHVTMGEEGGVEETTKDSILDELLEDEEDDL